MKNKTLIVVVLLLLLCAGRFMGGSDDRDGQPGDVAASPTPSESAFGDLLEQKGREGRMLYREGYVVCFDEASKIPYWVAWHLTAGAVMTLPKTRRLLTAQPLPTTEALDGAVVTCVPLVTIAGAGWL